MVGAFLFLILKRKHKQKDNNPKEQPKDSVQNNIIKK
jgi:hypothetical protein